MKTSELIGTALDWAVAKCEGLEIWSMGKWNMPIINACSSHQYSPSTNWAQGGPIIELERMLIRPCAEVCEGQWAAKPWDEKVDYAFGPTPLSAAMRCFVASKLGDEVEIPEELK